LEAGVKWKLVEMDRLAELVAVPERAVEVRVEEVPGLLARLASLQAVLLSRLLAPQNHAASPRSPAEPDRLLTAGEAAPILGTSERWLYRHAKQLPFSRRLSRKALRFSEVGLRRYMATRQR
jgi:predicted DNA-binding transcriptional regulator AlpA